MTGEKIYPVPAGIAKKAHIKADDYKKMYDRSLNDAENFWSEQAEVV